MIYGDAFSYCSSLSSIEIPNSVTRIEDRAFASCSSLNSVILSEFLEYIGRSAFDECISLESIIIPDSVITLGDGLFSGAVFANCYNLKSVVMGNSIESIGDSAFSDCDLSYIVIPASVREIYCNSGIFGNNINLEVVEFHGNMPPDLLGYKGGAHLFGYVPKLSEIRVPADSIDLYREALFDSLADIGRGDEIFDIIVPLP